MKKLLTAVLALVMCVAMSMAAFASEAGGETQEKNDSITVTGAKEDETYNLYKLFDLKVNSETEPIAYSYTINEDWTDFFTGEGAGAQYITVENGYVTAILDATALAKAAAAWSGKPAAKDTKSPGEGQARVTFSGLEDGYWLITSTLGTFAMTETTPDKAAVTVNEKNPEDTIEKEVKEDSTGQYGKSNDAQVGDIVEFQSKVKIVKGTRNVVVHDKMDSGLTYTPDSVAINGLTIGTEYTVNESPDDGDTFDITFTQSWIDGLDFGEAGYVEYIITYTATLNENAVVEGEDGVAILDQNNKTHVSYGDGTNSTEDSTTTTTHKFNVFKHAKDSEENLAGAVFSLKKNDTVVKLVKIDDTNYRVANGNEEGTGDTFTTVASGDIVIWGVDSDNDYSLEEITPPEGYNKLVAEVPVTVDAGNSTRVDVENNAGTELPSTGGTGTTMLYVIGAALVLCAGILLVVRRRMSSR